MDYPLQLLIFLPVSHTHQTFSDKLNAEASTSMGIFCSVQGDTHTHTHYETHHPIYQLQSCHHPNACIQLDKHHAHEREAMPTCEMLNHLQKPWRQPFPPQNSRHASPSPCWVMTQSEMVTGINISQYHSSTSEWQGSDRVQCVTTDIYISWIKNPHSSHYFKISTPVEDKLVLTCVCWSSETAPMGAALELPRTCPRFSQVEACSKLGSDTSAPLRSSLSKAYQRRNSLVLTTTRKHLIQSQSAVSRQAGWVFCYVSVHS